MFGTIHEALLGIAQAKLLAATGHPAMAIVRSASVTETFLYAVLFAGVPVFGSRLDVFAAARRDWGIDLTCVPGWPEVLKVWGRRDAVMDEGASYSDEQALADVRAARAAIDGLVVARVSARSLHVARPA